jgi:hypothetical protein
MGPSMAFGELILASMLSGIPSVNLYIEILWRHIVSIMSAMLQVGGVSHPFMGPGA